MRRTIAAIFLISFTAFGGEPGAFVEHLNLVGKITEALVASKLDHLTPHISQDGGKEFSYHLKAVSYLGTLEHGSEKVMLATALFLRSSAKGSEYPPARGHGYLLCLSNDLKLICHSRLDLPDVELVGTKLLRGQETIGDFAVSNEGTRRWGFLIDGDDFLLYPFADKLPQSHALKEKKP